MPLKEYLTVLEEKFVDIASKDDPKKELECVDEFIKLVEEDKLTVSTSGTPFTIC